MSAFDKEIIDAFVTELQMIERPMRPSLASQPTAEAWDPRTPYASDRQSDQGRIARLECIITILLEKNERFRRLLLSRMD